MLGYIIPPIVIVFSLGALIMFIFKKSAGIPEEMIMKERNAALSLEKKKLFRLTQFFLNLTEKIIQRFKLVSLKVYNRSDNLFHSVKEKREKRQSTRRENRESRFNQEGIRFERKRPNSLLIKEIKDEEEEKEEEEEVRPMVSQRVVQPDSRTNVRNEFERALIERIAYNPRDIEAYERLGDYYIEIGNFNDSLSCFEQVLVLSPVNRRAKLKVKRLQKIVFNKLD